MSEVETIVLKKPKKERSPAQLAATARLVESNRLKREAKKLAASGAKAPEKVPEPKKVSEDKPIEPVVKKVRKPRVKKAPPSPPPVEHYIDEDSQSEEQYEEEEFEEIREPEPEPLPVRSFRIPRHMRH
jgi:hypothetical protein